MSYLLRMRHFPQIDLEKKNFETLIDVLEKMYTSLV